MQSSLGNPARGEKYFFRPQIIDNIYENLGNHVFLSAPRRMGKTSTFYYLVENPRDNFLFLYFNSEAIDNPTSFFKQLLETVESCQQLTEHLTYSYQIQRAWYDVLHLLEQVNLGSIFEVTFHEPAKKRYHKTFATLLELLEKSPLTIVLLIDEFPQTILNIQDEYNEQKARQFLQIHRSLRMACGQNVRFIYTGSIGLQQVVSRLGAMTHINDLTTVSLPPLTYQEGYELATDLFAFHQTSLRPTAIDDLLKKLHFLLPYHLQLLVNNIAKEYKTTRQIVDNEIIEKAFNQLCEEYHSTFSSYYYDRLSKTFIDINNLAFAKGVLKEIAQQTKMKTSSLKKLANDFTLKSSYTGILAILTHDGYIVENQDYYYFQSPILFRWWQKYGMD